LGFTATQATDLLIMLNLSTKSDIVDWMSAVGKDDVEYGIQLMHTAVELQVCEAIDSQVDNMKKFKEAMFVINGVK
jgi:hypothetical protein